MKELVERVAIAIAKAAGQEWDQIPATYVEAFESIKSGGTACCQKDYLDEAIAAIRAVAGWLNEQSVNSAVPGASPEYMVARALIETLQAKEAGE